MQTVVRNHLGLQMPILKHLNLWEELTEKWEDRCEDWDGYSKSDISHPGVLWRLYWRKFNTIRLEIPIYSRKEFFKTAVGIAKDAKSREEFKQMFEEKNALLRGELEKLGHITLTDIMRDSDGDVQDDQFALTDEPIDEEFSEVSRSYSGFDGSFLVIYDHYEGSMGPEDWLKDNDFLPPPEERSQSQRKRFVPPYLSNT
ncbi:hypothetical protein ACQKWADRAFT_52040 [Trichoderma austrokoningii]